MSLQHQEAKSRIGLGRKNLFQCERDNETISDAEILKPDIKSTIVCYQWVTSTKVSFH